MTFEALCEVFVEEDEACVQRWRGGEASPCGIVEGMSFMIEVFGFVGSLSGLDTSCEAPRVIVTYSLS